MTLTLSIAMLTSQSLRWALPRPQISGECVCFPSALRPRECHCVGLPLVVTHLSACFTVVSFLHRLPFIPSLFIFPSHSHRTLIRPRILILGFENLATKSGGECNPPAVLWCGKVRYFLSEYRLPPLINAPVLENPSRSC